jgi:hypothetical protein
MKDAKAIVRKIADVERKMAESAKLWATLKRQLAFEATYGIKPHEITSIVVRGPKSPQPTSVLKMKDGSSHTVAGINAYRVLQGLDT